ncbi:hypothetical protein T01_4519 [Trichinella spiralis]|uniref:Uncharacterized protein n=1 Tax=Trichinella spiralis TaxID=6334 RepID=A0A0V0YP83_TRISP|nr:hypothetical protein T01_4519 [Trichinella spiralis]
MLYRIFWLESNAIQVYKPPYQPSVEYEQADVSTAN